MEVNFMDLLQFADKKWYKMKTSDPKFQPPVTISSWVTAALSLDLEAIFRLTSNALIGHFFFFIQDIKIISTPISYL